MHVAADVDEGFAPLPLDRWLPLASGAREKLDSVLASIPGRFAGAKAIHNCLGAVCKAAVNGREGVYGTSVLVRCVAMVSALVFAVAR